jgi:hypothetical protein
MRTFQDGNGEGCSRCKTLFEVLDTDDTSMVRAEDEMLISFDDDKSCDHPHNNNQ